MEEKKVVTIYQYKTGGEIQNFVRFPEQKGAGKPTTLLQGEQWAGTGASFPVSYKPEIYITDKVLQRSTLQVFPQRR